ncbi:hypothetical protein F5Y10DRAFT_208651 [Nemania abortiva]|nr:hypothetical protein F5Y10DRAFT_208651 [Nemania abortiva]
MSKNIVIAGPGSLGKHVLDALLQSGQFNVTVFSRSPKLTLEGRGAIIRVVDYDDVSCLRAALRSAQADTILSFIVDLRNPNSTAQSHRNLLEAAVAEGITRFIPAEYANDVARFPTPPASEADKLHFREHARDVCRVHNIESTLVCNGIIMDFFLPRGRKKYFADLPPKFSSILPVNLEAEPSRVVILGNPKDKISMTMADDVARGVVRLLLVPRGGWDDITYFSGDRVSWEEAAEILGRVLHEQVERSYVTLEDLESEVDAARKEGDAVKVECAELRRAFGNGSEVLPTNAKCFEGMVTTKFEQVVRKYYGKEAS